MPHDHDLDPETAGEQLARAEAHLAETSAKRAKFRAVFDTPVGNEVLIEVLRLSGVLAPQGEVNDPYTLAYDAGRRRVGMHILTMLEDDDAALLARMRRQWSQINGEGR